MDRFNEGLSKIKEVDVPFNNAEEVINSTIRGLYELGANKLNSPINEVNIDGITFEKALDLTYTDKNAFLRNNGIKLKGVGPTKKEDSFVGEGNPVKLEVDNNLSSNKDYGLGSSDFEFFNMPKLTSRTNKVGSNTDYVITGNGTIPASNKVMRPLRKEERKKEHIYKLRKIVVGTIVAATIIGASLFIAGGAQNLTNKAVEKEVVSYDSSAPIVPEDDSSEKTNTVFYARETIKLNCPEDAEAFVKNEMVHFSEDSIRRDQHYEDGCAAPNKLSNAKEIFGWIFKTFDDNDIFLEDAVFYITDFFINDATRSQKIILFNDMNGEVNEKTIEFLNEGSGISLCADEILSIAREERGNAPYSPDVINLKSLDASELNLLKTELIDDCMAKGKTI